MRPSALLLSLLLAGCVEPDRRPRRDTDEPATPTGLVEDTAIPAPVPLSVEVGTGDQDHHPLVPGGEVELVFGGQGGFHVDVSGVVQGLGEVVVVWVWVTRTDTGQTIARGSPLGTAMRLGAYDPVTETGVFVGERAYLANNSLTWVCGLEGVDLEIKASVEDLADRRFQAGGWAVGPGRIDASIADSCGTTP